MSDPSREAIHQALFAYADTISWTGLDGPTGFVSKFRKLIVWDEVPDQPALCQRAHRETISQVSRLPYKRMLKVNWIVYHQGGKDDPDTVPDTETNAILDAVFDAFETSADIDDRLTLGDLVYHAFIDGEIEKYNGDADGQSMIVIPITILAP